MVIEEETEKAVKNIPSDGSLRKVTNALGVIGDAEDNAPTTEIEIVCDDFMFAGCKLPLSVIGRDLYRRETKVNQKTVAYESAHGTIADNMFSPDCLCMVTITATCGDFQTQKQVYVLPEPRELYFKNNIISLKSGESFVPELFGKDEMGTEAKIRLEDAKVSVSGDAIEVTGNTVKAKKKGTAVLTATFGEVTANMVIAVDEEPQISVPENKTIPDSANKDSVLYADDAYRFSVFGNSRKCNTLFDLFVTNHALHMMKNNSEFQVFLGANTQTKDVERICTDYVITNNYNCFKKGNDTFITLPNVEGVTYR